MDPLDFRLVNEFQRDFPLLPRPFAELARRTGSTEDAVLGALRRLRGEGVISRVGAVFSPRRIGASTLAALAAPAERLEEIAACVSARPEVNHNYEREHAFNLWFVVTAADEAGLARALAEIERDSGCKVISLPLEHEFHIDLGFDLAGVCKARSSERRLDEDTPRSLEDGERRLLAVLQHGLELVPRPFARLGEEAGLDERQVIALLERWHEEGLIKRFGVVVRHHELGYTANAMVVWNLPDDAVERAGKLLAAQSEVTLCYRRRRHLPEWPYNLFCMIHGRARGEVEAAVAGLRQRLGLQQAPHAVLFSRRRFKQRGAHYLPRTEALHG